MLSSNYRCGSARPRRHLSAIRRIPMDPRVCFNNGSQSLTHLQSKSISTFDSNFSSWCFSLTLGNVDTPTDFDGASSGPGPRRPSAPSRAFRPQASFSNVALADHAWTSIPSHLLTISPTTLHRTAACSNASMSHPTSHNDSFMSWEPHRQHDWSMRSIQPS